MSANRFSSILSRLQHILSQIFGRNLPSDVIVSFLVGIFYIIMSSLTVIMNRVMPYTYHFTATNFLLFFQMIVTVLVLKLLAALKIVHIEPFQIPKAKKVFPLTLFYILNASLSLLSLRYLNISAYSVVKRLTPILLIPFDIWIRGKVISWKTQLAVLIIVIGTLCVALHDQTEGSSLGYMIGLISCSCQALYLIYVKKSGAEAGFSSVQLLYYHGIIGTPMFLPILFATKEIEFAWNYTGWNDLFFIIVLFSWPLLGMLLNYALFLCTEKTTPITTSLCGQFKASFLMILGFFILGGDASNSKPGYFVGMLLNFIGSVMYFYFKWQDLDKSGHPHAHYAPEEQRSTQIGSVQLQMDKIENANANATNSTNVSSSPVLNNTSLTSPILHMSLHNNMAQSESSSNDKAAALNIIKD